MASYNTIRGLRVKYLSADPANPEDGQVWYNAGTGNLRVDGILAPGSFSSGGNLNTGRYAIGSAGTFTAGLAIGGDLFGSNPSSRGSNSTEEYNGTSWTGGGNLGTSGSWRAGAGTQTAASGTAGNNYSSYMSTSENYDGSSWTSSTSAPYAAEGSVSTGSRAASIWGGGGAPSQSPEYPPKFFYGDGEGWTAITNSNNANRYASVFTGTQTAALLTGGQSPQTANTESWNGSSWTNLSAFPTPFANAAGNRVGTSTAAVAAGGASPGGTLTSSSHWNGSSWSTDASMAQAHNSSSSAGTQEAYYVAGGPGAAPLRNATEEYTGGSVITKNLSTS